MRVRLLEFFSNYEHLKLPKTRVVIAGIHELMKSCLF